MLKGLKADRHAVKGYWFMSIRLTDQILGCLNLHMVIHGVARVSTSDDLTSTADTVWFRSDPAYPSLQKKFFGSIFSPRPLQVIRLSMERFEVLSTKTHINERFHEMD